MFELTYDDLFLEHNDYIIFLIYFDYFQIELFRGAFLSEWYFWQALPQKYCFSFDLDKGKIRFYRENIVKSQSNKKLKKKNLSSGINKIFYPLVIILVVFLLRYLLLFLKEYQKEEKELITHLLIMKANLIENDYFCGYFSLNNRILNISM